MMILVWSALGFTLGALPFSYWLGRAFLGVDVRDYGTDRNPGAGNAWRAGGWRLGLPAGLLDVGKASAALLLARGAGIDGWGLVPIALAPLLGHALSPFLGFHGGKSGPPPSASGWRSQGRSECCRWRPASVLSMRCSAPTPGPT